MNLGAKKLGGEQIWEKWLTTNMIIYWKIWKYVDSLDNSNVIGLSLLFQYFDSLNPSLKSSFIRLYTEIAIENFDCIFSIIMEASTFKITFILFLGLLARVHSSDNWKSFGNVVEDPSNYLFQGKFIDPENNPLWCAFKDGVGDEDVYRKLGLEEA